MTEFLRNFNSSFSFFFVLSSLSFSLLTKLVRELAPQARGSGLQPRAQRIQPQCHLCGCGTDPGDGGDEPAGLGAAPPRGGSGGRGLAARRGRGGGIAAVAVASEQQRRRDEALERALPRHSSIGSGGSGGASGRDPVGSGGEDVGEARQQSDARPRRRRRRFVVGGGAAAAVASSCCCPLRRRRVGERSAQGVQDRGRAAPGNAKKRRGYRSRRDGEGGGRLIRGGVFVAAVPASRLPPLLPAALPSAATPRLLHHRASAPPGGAE